MKAGLSKSLIGSLMGVFVDHWGYSYEKAKRRADAIRVHQELTGDTD
jgi:hypothetical protein